MESVKRLGKSLSVLTGQVIEVLDVDDNRLTHLLTHLSQEAVRDAIERLLGERCVEIYELRPKGVRCDATTVSGYHQVTTDGVMPFGHSKGDPTLPPGNWRRRTWMLAAWGGPWRRRCGPGNGRTMACMSR